jgi:hypothetical protein
MLALGGESSSDRRQEYKMLYELREYTSVPGRLPALIERFNAVTVEMFRRHKMDLVFLSRTDFRRGLQERDRVRPSLQLL